MKKLLLIMLASLFMMMSCDILAEDEDNSTTSNNDYAGTWVDSYTSESYPEDNYTDTYTFTDSTFQKTSIDEEGTSIIKGTVSVDGDQLTTAITYYNDETTTYQGSDLTALAESSGEELTSLYTYLVDGDTLTLTSTDTDDGETYTATFTKQ